MARRRKREKRQSKSNKDGPVFVQSPFSDLDPQLLKEAYQSKAKEDAERFPDLIAEAQRLFTEVYPPHLVAVIAQYGLMTVVGDDGVHTEKTGNRIDQHHVELLLALSLTVDSATWGSEPANPETIQKTMDLVRDLADAFHFKRLAERDLNTDDKARFVTMLQEHLRAHTQMVRNWSHFSGVVKISKELYSALDEPIKKTHGFSATDAIAVLEAAVRLHERRQSDKFQRLRKVIREKSRSRIGRKLQEHFPEFAGNAVDWVNGIPADWLIQGVKAEVMNLTDRLAMEHSIFTPSELSAETGIDETTIELVLMAISLEIDGLLGSNPEHLFLENPIWNAPFVNDRGSFYCSIPQAAFSHIHRIMKRLLKDAGASDALSQRRAKYLEAKVDDTFQKHLPTAKLSPACEWSIDGVKYETDLLAVVDQTVIIVEAKSNALTPEGLRGAPKRVERHVRELVGDPALQSQRLQNEILKAKSGDHKAIKLVEALGIDPSTVEVILRLSVTLDDFSVLSSSELSLKDAGWISPDLSLPPTLNIADFICVCDILEEPAFILHYLSERERVQKTQISADELDFLGFYLATGFNTTAITDDTVGLQLTGMSSDVDHYYNSLEAGVAVPKPKPKVHAELLEIVQASQKRGAKGWTIICPALLGLGDFREQKMLFKGLEKLRKNVRKRFRDPKHECAAVVQPPDYREFAYVFHVYPEALRQGRDAAMSELAQTAMEDQGRQKCIVVSKKLENGNWPYNCIAMLWRSDDGS